MKRLFIFLALLVVAGTPTNNPPVIPPVPPPMQTNIIVQKSAAPTFVVAPTNFGTLSLAWDYPTNELATNISFNVRATATVTAPLIQWAIVTNTTAQQVRLSIQPGLAFFIVTATNSVADTNSGVGQESLPSNWISRPPIAPSGTTISR